MSSDDSLERWCSSLNANPNSYKKIEIPCPWASRFEMCPCKWKGVHASLPAHIQEQHSKDLLVGCSHRFEVPLNCEFSQDHVISVWGELFTANLEGSTNGAVIQCAAKYMGPSARATEFSSSFKIKLRDAAGVTRSFQYSRTMYTYYKPLFMAYYYNDAFSVTAKELQFYSSDEKVIVELTIERHS